MNKFKELLELLPADKRAWWRLGRRALRVLLTFWIAVPLLLLGWLLGLLWPNVGGVMSLVGLWLLGVEIVLG
jgi:hypothetical protein